MDHHSEVKRRREKAERNKNAKILNEQLRKQLASFIQLAPGNAAHWRKEFENFKSLFARFVHATTIDWEWVFLGRVDLKNLDISLSLLIYK